MNISERCENSPGEEYQNKSSAGSLIPDWLKDVDPDIAPEARPDLLVATPAIVENPISEPAPTRKPSIFDEPLYHYEKGPRGEKVLVAGPKQ